MGASSVGKKIASNFLGLPSWHPCGLLPVKGHYSTGASPHNLCLMENEFLTAQLAALLIRLSAELMDLEVELREAGSEVEQELALMEMVRLAGEMQRKGWESGG